MENTAVEHAATSSGPNLLMPETLLAILTWVTFFIVLFILQKYAFKPIMANLQTREREIKEALENADKAKAQLALIEQERQKVLDEAKAQAADIINQSRKTAKDLAADIEAKTRLHAQEIIQSAQNEMETEKQRLIKELRQESAEIAVTLAGKIIQENMDQEKNRRLIKEATDQL